MYWEAKSFDLCHECLKSLFVVHIDPTLKQAELVEVTRQLIPESLRNKVLDRDGNKCLLCGCTEYLQMDHIVPFSRGGRTVEGNLQTLCKTCNSKKRAK